VSRPSELILAVAVGSAAGGVARYLLTESVQLRTGSAFPFGTLFVNILGCFALGFITQLVLQQGDASPRLRALLTTGLTGGFTTFSAFSLETVRMLEDGNVGGAAGNIGLSVALGLAALWLGMAAGRMVRPS
jgi:CrcB protein